MRWQDFRLVDPIAYLRPLRIVARNSTLFGSHSGGRAIGGRQLLFFPFRKRRQARGGGRGEFDNRFPLGEWNQQSRSSQTGFSKSHSHFLCSSWLSLLIFSFLSSWPSRRLPLEENQYDWHAHTRVAVSLACVRSGPLFFTLYTVRVAQSFATFLTFPKKFTRPLISALIFNWFNQIITLNSLLWLHT